MTSDRSSSTDIIHDKHRQYRQSLGDQVNTIEQEARMVLPGIQTLFGFQLIAVFNQGFKGGLSQGEQIIHLCALLLVAISAVLVVAPAAYHRQAKHNISKHFIELSSHFLAWAMVPLALGTCLDIYLVTRMILISPFLSMITTAIIFTLYAWTWFILPNIRAKQIEQLPIHDILEEKKT
ncbi:MAG: hypothetical protein H7281_17590 [Bacteriovorax sp.]|nr:hypothetical protein [Bacteriovorax sp.]